MPPKLAKSKQQKARELRAAKKRLIGALTSEINMAESFSATWSRPVIQDPRHMSTDRYIRVLPGRDVTITIDLIMEEDNENHG